APGGGARGGERPGPSPRRPQGAMWLPPRPQGGREAPPVAVADLFVGFFRRDLPAFFPQSRFEPVAEAPGRSDAMAWPGFRVVEADGGGTDAVEMFGVRYAIGPRGGGRFSAHDRRLIPACRCRP